nr:hypothetical protein CFP56_10396 [Quercus suber]
MKPGWSARRLFLRSPPRRDDGGDGGDEDINPFGECAEPVISSLMHRHVEARSWLSSSAVVQEMQRLTKQQMSLEVDLYFIHHAATHTTSGIPTPGHMANGQLVPAQTRGIGAFPRA